MVLEKPLSGEGTASCLRLAVRAARIFSPASAREGARPPSSGGGLPTGPMREGDQCGGVGRPGSRQRRLCLDFLERCQAAGSDGKFSLPVGTEKIFFEDSSRCVAAVPRIAKLALGTFKPGRPLGEVLQEFQEKNSVYMPDHGPGAWGMREAARLLREYGLLRADEGGNTLLQGRVVAVRRSERGRRGLFIAYADIHDDAQVQRQIVGGITALRGRGLPLVGLEGLTSDFTNRDQLLGPGECHSRSFQSAAALLLCGSSYKRIPDVVGTEDATLYRRNVRQVVDALVYAQVASFSPRERCEAIRKQELFFDTATDRSDAMVVNLLGHMQSLGARSSAMVVGAAHLYDFPAIANREDVDYIGVAVPSVDEQMQGSWRAWSSIDVDALGCGTEEAP